MIDASEAEVLEWALAQSGEHTLAGAVRIEIAASHLLEQILKLFV
jgi:hypothetical protein